MSEESEVLIDRSEPQNENQHRNYDTANFQEEGISAELLTKAKRSPQYIAAISATLSAMAAGIVLGWTSPISTDIENGMFHNITVSSNQMGWIGSFTTLGALSLCFVTGILCDFFGRKLTLLLLIVPYGLGWSLIVYANSLVMLYFGRFITGMAAGACCIAAPLYINEIAQKEIRGTLGSYFQLMVTVGILYAYVFGKFLNITDFTLICACVPFVFVLIFIFQPETPVFYLKNLQYEKAKAALVKLRGSEYDVEAELRAMEYSVRNVVDSNSSNYQLLKKRATVRAFIIALGLMFFQQYSGINAVIFYTSDIFEASHVKLDPKVASILVGTFQVVATFISSLIVDRAGRRILLIASTAIMAISSIFLGLFFTLKDREDMSDTTITSLGFLPVVSLCVFVIVFSLGIGPIPWIIPSEIFSLEVKGMASSIVGSFNWFLAFLITKFYLNLEASMGEDSVFYMFAVISIIGTVFVFLILPETKGKSSEEIQRLLEE